MKIRNKKTGEIVIKHLAIKGNNEVAKTYNSLAELNEEYEDYEETKEYWSVEMLGEPINVTGLSSLLLEKLRKIDNLFETKEEAEKAVEKLKAWKRLKDKGFKPDAVVDSFFCIDIFMKGKPYEEIKEDLKIVFGGEE